MLQYWCRHSDTPITFSDRTQAQPEESVEHADPFAAFADGGTTTGPSTPVGDPETINEPMLLDSPLQVELQTDGVRVVAGYSDAPSFGYYNGGLTLIETGNPEVLGVYEQRLGHIGFKVKYDALEHTLTRDNVLHDESWTHAMAVVQRASLELRRLLMDKLTAESEAGRDLRRWHGLLALECRATAFHQDRPDFDDRCVFRDSGGRRVTLAELSRAEDDLGAVLLDGGGKALEDAVMAKGYPVLPDQPEVRDLLEASFEPSGLPFGRKERRIASVGHVFGLAWPLEPAQLSRSEQRLLEEVQQLLRLSAGRGVHVAVGEFQGTQAKATDPLALEGPMEGGLFRRLEPKLLRAPLFIRKRYVLLDRHHPTFNALLLAAQEDLHVAACSLGQLLLDAADVRATAPFREILQHAWERSHGVGS